MNSQLQAADGLRILHWNVHGWRDDGGQLNVQAVIELIRATRPHAVSLVEVDEPWGRAPALSSVAGECGYSWALGASFEYGEGTSGGAFGNAVLARVPVTAVQQWRLYAPTSGYDGSEPSEPRSVILARLELDGTSCWVGSTHFPRADADARAAAVTRLRHLTAALDEPWLVCGDFNAPPAELLSANAGLKVSPDPAQPSHPANDPSETIDYCLSPAQVTMSATILPVPGSDHLPLLVAAKAPQSRM